MNRRFERISSSQQKEARDKAKDKYLDIKNVTQKNGIIEAVEKFKTQYSYCEITYMILYDYREGKRIDGSADSRRKCSANTVTSVLKYCGYQFDDEMIQQIFGKSGKRNHLSARKLRNNLTHDCKKQDIDELILRYDDIMDCMQRFLDMINKATNTNT